MGKGRKSKGDESPPDFSKIPLEKRDGVVQLLEAFAGISDEATLYFDYSVTSFERMFVHHTAEEMSLHSESYGQSTSRYIEVSKYATGENVGHNGSGKAKGKQNEDDWSGIPQERQDELVAINKALAESPFIATVSFGVEMSAYERKFVHATATEYNLSTESKGEKNGRYISIWKASIDQADPFSGIPAKRQADLKERIASWIEKDTSPTLKFEVELTVLERKFVDTAAKELQLLYQIFGDTDYYHGGSNVALDDAASMSKRYVALLNPKHPSISLPKVSESVLVREAEAATPDQIEGQRRKWQSMALDRAVNKIASRLTALAISQRPATRRALETMCQSTQYILLYSIAPIDVFCDLVKHGHLDPTASKTAQAGEIVKNLVAPVNSATTVAPELWPPEMKKSWLHPVPQNLSARSLAAWVCARASVRITVQPTYVADSLIQAWQNCEEVEGRLLHSNKESPLPGSDLTSVMWEIPPPQKKLKKAAHVKTAVIIELPNDCEAYAAIQEIRKQHDPAFSRWMPHINLLYPFVPTENISVLDLWVSAAKCQRFQLHLNTMGYFDHGSKCTVYLAPHASECKELWTLRECLARALPEYDWGDSDSFKPHLTLGKYEGKPGPELFSFMDKLAKDHLHGKEVSYEVIGPKLISRDDGEDTGKGKGKDKGKFKGKGKNTEDAQGPPFHRVAEFIMPAGVGSIALSTQSRDLTVLKTSGGTGDIEAEY